MMYVLTRKSALSDKVVIGLEDGPRERTAHQLMVLDLPTVRFRQVAHGDITRNTWVPGML